MIALKFIRINYIIDEQSRAIYSAVDDTTIDSVLESELTVTKRVELNETFKYFLSYSDIKFINDHGEIETFLSLASLAVYDVGVEIIKDGTCIFWGQLDKDSVEYDEINEVFSLTVIDWFKWIQAFWDKFTPSIATYGAYGSDIAGLIKSSIPSVIADNAEIAADANELVYSEETMYNIFLRRMPAKHFLNEILKRFGAYCYVSADKKFRIVGRSFRLDRSQTSDVGVLLDDRIIGNDIKIKKYELSNYDSILVNYFLPVAGHPDGGEKRWILIYGDRYRGGQSGTVVITSWDQVETATAGHKYLDLREVVTWYIDKWWLLNPDASGQYISTLFPERLTSESWQAYKGFINPHSLHYLKVTGTDLDLFYDVRYFGYTNLFVYEIKLNLFNDTSELTMMEIME